MKFFVLFICNITLFASCTKIIEIDLPKHPQKPVISCFFTKDSTFKMQVTKSVGILDDYQQPIDHATIYLFENDIRKDTLEYNGQLFESDIVADIGKTYAFTAEVENFDEVSASDFLPEIPVLGDCIIIDKTIIVDEEDSYNQEIQIDIHDVDAENNYYELYLFKKYIDTLSNELNLYSFYCYSLSPVVENEGLPSDVNESLVFSDELFNNDIGEIKINYNKPRYAIGYPFIDDYSIIVVLKNVSKSYYTYKKKLYQHLFNQDSEIWYGLGEPVEMYSNIENGYGIFAGYSEVKREVFPD